MLLYGLIAVFGAAGTTGAFLLWIRHRTSLQDWLRAYPPFGFFWLALALIAVAQISDTDFWFKLAIAFMEELLETNASLAFLFAALALRGGRRTYQVVPSLS
jgi:hypothetical protein